MPLPKTKAAFILLFAAMLMVSFPAGGYEEEGHFYTIIGAQHLATHRSDNPGGRDAAQLYGFCAQIADLASELEALTVRYNAGIAASWVTRSRCTNPATQHMANVHQYLHALTGSEAVRVTKAAVNIVSQLRDGINESGSLEAASDSNRACAVGLGLHLLGDSFAHRQFLAPGWTYKPGIGHWRDMHYPDYMSFSSPRADLWRLYLQELARALSLDVDQSRFALLARIAQDHLGGDDENRFNKQAILETLLQTLKEPAPDQTTSLVPYSPHLEGLYGGQYVLDKSFDEIVERYKAVLPGGESLNFRSVWQIYLDVAIKEFDNAEVRVVCQPGRPGQ